MTENQVKLRSKWAILKLIRAQSGIVNWYPIVTFFPKGTIVDDLNADGMDFVQQFISEGLVEEKNHEQGPRTFCITALGQEQLSKLETDAK